MQETPIEEITSHGIRAGGAEHKLDDLVFATGFDSFTGSLLRMNVRGRSGLRLEAHWRQGARTYASVATRGFPNFFMIMGPQSGFEFNITRNIERNVDWVARCIAYMKERGYLTIDVDRNSEELWLERVNQAARASLVSEADSWWWGTNIPGKPRTIQRFVGGAQFYEAFATVTGGGYRGFEFSTR